MIGGGRPGDASPGPRLCAVKMPKRRQHAVVDRRRGRRRLEGAPGDPLVSLDVGQGGLPDQLRRDFRDLVPVRIASCGDPGADHVLVETFGGLAGREALRIGVGAPVAAGIGSVNLVGEAEGSLGVQPEFILGVGEDQAALGGQRLAAGEQGQRGFAHLQPLGFAEQTAREDLAFGQRLVMRPVGGLASGGDDRRFERLVVGEAVG